MIVGQEHVTADIDRIFAIFTASKCTIKPHFFLAGPSGSGKTFIIEMLAAKHKVRVVTVNAASITKEGTSGNSISKALSPLAQLSEEPVIVFVDEFDKLFISGNTNSQLAHESTNGVQNEFLKVLEGKAATVYGDFGKYIDVPVTKVLFVFAGAFNGQPNITLNTLKTFGVKNEFLGRVPLVYQTRKLTLEELIFILEHSKLLDKYLRLLNKDKAPVFDTIKDFLEKSYDENSIGARQVDSLIHQYFIGGKLVLKEPEEENMASLNFNV